MNAVLLNTVPGNWSCKSWAANCSSYVKPEFTWAEA